jgi:hypothetical protein
MFDFCLNILKKKNVSMMIDFLFFYLDLPPAVPVGRQQPKQPLLHLDEVVVVVIRVIVQVQLYQNFDVFKYLLIHFFYIK